MLRSDNTFASNFQKSSTYYITKSQEKWAYQLYQKFHEISMPRKCHLTPHNRVKAIGGLVHFLIINILRTNAKVQKLYKICFQVCSRVLFHIMWYFRFIIPISDIVASLPHKHHQFAVLSSLAVWIDAGLLYLWKEFNG